MIVVDAANVIGSRPDGWWRDRAGAAATLCARLSDAIAGGRLAAPVVVVLEGAARAGAAERDEGGLRIAHATRSGDDAIVSVSEGAASAGTPVLVVTADRGLRGRVEALGCDVAGPRWLLDLL